MTGGIATPHSEYPLKAWTPLQPHFELHSDSDAVFVEGVGIIAQYHHYSDMMYSHGFIYFLRDFAIKELQSCVDPKYRETLLERIERLNSKIRVYESHGRTAH